MAIRVTWNDNSTGEEGSRVYRSDSQMSPGSLPAPVGTVGPDVTEFIIPGVDTGYIRVEAYGGGTTALSEELEVGIVNAPRALFVVAGQSNARAFRTTGNDMPSGVQTTYADARIWNTTTQAFETYVAGTNSDDYTSGAFTPQKWGPEAGLIAAFKEANPGTRIDIIKVSADASALEDNDFEGDWDPSNTGELFDALETQVNAAKAALTAESVSDVVTGFFWVQGEEDAEVEVESRNYRNNLVDLFSAIQSRIGDSSTIMCLNLLSPSDGKEYAYNVRAAQMRFVKDTILARSMYIDDYVFAPDGYHVEPASVETHGRDFNDLFSNVYGEPQSQFGAVSGKDFNAACVISNSGRTLTGGSGNPLQRAQLGTYVSNAGKSYYEFEITSLTGNSNLGIGRPPAVNGYWGGQDNECVGYSANGFAYRGINNTVLAQLTPWAEGDVVGIAHDGATGEVWFSLNGAWSGDPSAGTGAITALNPVASNDMSRVGVCCRGEGDAFTVPVSPNYPVPTGFTWDL